MDVDALRQGKKGAKGWFRDPREMARHLVVTVAVARLDRAQTGLAGTIPRIKAQKHKQSGRRGPKDKVFFGSHNRNNSSLSKRAGRIRGFLMKRSVREQETTEQ